MKALGWFRRVLPLGSGCVATALSLGACTSSGQPQSAADVEKKQSEEDARLDKAAQLVGSFRAKVPDTVASRARCILVVPDFKKGGLIVGGEGGKGFATCLSGGTWSAPAPISLGGGTLGAQIGYESGDVLALVVSDSAVKALEAGNFKIGASASASAGPVGGTAAAAGDVGVKSEILTYAHSGGLFAGATLNGTTVSSDDRATRALYGVQVDLASILEGRTTMPERASLHRFVSAVNSAFAPAAVSFGQERDTVPTASW